MEVMIPCLVTVILFLASTLLLQRFMRKSENFRLPPGPPQLPIIGNLHQFVVKNKPPHQRLLELARVYGPIMHLRLGEIPTVVVSSAEGAKEVLKTHDIHLASRPKLVAVKALFYDSDIVFSPYGEYWRQLRKIATLELLTMKRVQSFRHIREEEVSKLIKSIASDVASEGVVNLSDKLFNLIFNITSRVVFSKEGEGQESFKVLLANIVDVMTGFSVADLYPSVKWLDSISGMRRKLKEMVKESDRMLDPILEEHICKRRQGKTEEDLVDVLLRFHKDSPDAHTNHSLSLTTDNIKALILEIFSAGNETSFGVIEWAMSELLRNPKLMEKAQVEVREVHQGKEMITEASLHELRFLKLVVKETLRLHFTVPLLIPRESMEHCQIQSYDIPPKTRVLVNAWAIARDPKHWTDPDSFIPERFESSSIDYKGTNFEFIPFGAGRRICPGMTLGLANVELSLATLLYHFDWKLPTRLKPEELNMDEVHGVTVRRKNQLNVVPIPHTSLGII